MSKLVTIFGGSGFGTGFASAPKLFLKLRSADENQLLSLLLSSISILKWSNRLYCAFTISLIVITGKLVEKGFCELSFKEFDEVIERANSNDLGLCSYIYTNNLEKAHKASESMETGCVAVNTPVVAVAEAPFGGIKQTGYGREGGSMAIKDYLNIKYTHFGISYEWEKINLKNFSMQVNQL